MKNKYRSYVMLQYDDSHMKKASSIKFKQTILCNNRAISWLVIDNGPKSPASGDSLQCRLNLVFLSWNCSPWIKKNVHSVFWSPTVQLSSILNQCPNFIINHLMWTPVLTTPSFRGRPFETWTEWGNVVFDNWFGCTLWSC